MKIKAFPYLGPVVVQPVRFRAAVGNWWPTGPRGSFIWPPGTIIEIVPHPSCPPRSQGLHENLAQRVCTAPPLAKATSRFMLWSEFKNLLPLFFPQPSISNSNACGCIFPISSTQTEGHTIAWLNENICFQFIHASLNSCKFFVVQWNPFKGNSQTELLLISNLQKI